jgi:hypothetical protein
MPDALPAPYAFPADLAAQVLGRWNRFVSRHDRPAPPLPAESELRRVLETAFFASFLREEGRDLRFVLCCAESLEVPLEGRSETVSVAALATPRALTVEALRALAPAVSPDNSALLVRFGADESAQLSEIAGILNIGSDLARARSGRSFYHRPAPYALTVDVRDAGELHIYRGGIKLATLRAGLLHDQIAFSSLELLPVSQILAQGEQALRARTTPPADEDPRETSDFEWTALLNTVLCVVNGIKELAHGGTVLIVAPGAEATLPVRIKYRLDEAADVLGQRFVRFLNARHELVAEGQRRSGGGADGSLEALRRWQAATFEAEEDLADAADLVAGLSSVDGAVVMTSDLRVLGFGAEIVLDAATPVRAFEASGGARTSAELPEVDSESFGMRHRSAIRGVAMAQASAAFVVSQDGTVTLCWKKGSDVFIKRDINTSNPNLVGA